MITNFLKSYFAADHYESLSNSKRIFQRSVLRILLLLTAAVFLSAEIHSLFIEDELPLFGIHNIYLVLVIVLFFLSKNHTQLTAILFTGLIIATNYTLLTLSDVFDARKYALISLYSLPLIVRLLFNFKASLIAMVINIYPFYLMTLEHFALSDSSAATPSFYFQLLTFVMLNLGLPLAVSRIIYSLEKSASSMRGLYKQLNDNYHLYEEFFENTGTPTLLCDQRGKLLKTNQLAHELLKIPEDNKLINTKITDWLIPNNKQGKLFWQSNVEPCKLKSNPSIHIEVNRAVLTKHNYYVLHLQDTTQLRAMQKELKNTQQTNSRLAHFDLLTLLPNSRSFCRQVNELIEEHKSEKHLTGAMFIVRISQFKLLNKQYGKDQANKIILNFSKALQQKMSDQAIIGRLRGVKFSCFVPLNQTHLIAKNLSTLINSVLPKQIGTDGNRFNMDYQIGVTYYQVDGDTAEALLERCEMALEHASSTERISYYNKELENQLIQEHKLGLDLSSAIKNNDIDIWLQPQICPNGRICAFEALARWRHQGKQIPPDTFIKVAEDLGLLPLLAENLVKALVTTLESWHKEQIETPIAFNLAGQELMNDSFYALLMNLISDKPWLGKMLELEITETSPLMTHSLIHKRLRSLSQYGFSIAIDDFGTGQASLGQLIDIPADTLKIDRRFVAPLPNDQRHIDIVKSTIQLAESMNMQVIAEGIETKEQANLLFALGCHLLQGYYFAKPAPISEWTAENNEKAKTLLRIAQ